MRHTRVSTVICTIALLGLVPLTPVAARHGVYLPLIIANSPGAPIVTPTRTPTRTPTLTATPTAETCLDAYEPDDEWYQARIITVDGSLQSHAHHTASDADWQSSVLASAVVS